MRHARTLAAVFAVALIVGCASQSRTLYNTLASVQATTAGAYNAYLDLVVKGQLKTNMVPVVSRDFNLFQLTWSAAVAVAQWNTNSVAPPEVLAASTQVLTSITTAKVTP